MTNIFDEKPLIQETKDLFFANLAHDLKNPLQAQIISLELISKGLFGDLNKKQFEMLSYTIESARFMQKILYSLLNSYKYNNCQLIINKRKFKLYKLIDECINETKAQAKTKKITISTNINNAIELYADEIHIRRVFQNIFNNALNYSTQNSTIEIFTKITQNKLLISVTNQIGTHKDFSPSQNFGLGLNTIKQIIQAHGGNTHIHIDDKKYTLSIELPV